MKNFFVSTLLLLCFFSVNAQSQFDEANFRVFELSNSLSYDTRLPAMMYKPAVELKLFDGRLIVGGFANLQLAKMEEWDKRVLKPNESLIGTNIAKPYSSYEFYGCINILNSFNPSATVTTSKSYGRWTFVSSEPGTRAHLLSAKIGFGSISSKIGLYGHPFALQDSTGNKYEGNSTIDYNRYDKYANTNTNYFFIGPYYMVCQKGQSSSGKGRGGSTVVLFLDLIVPTKMAIDAMYSPSNEKFNAIPRKGESWTPKGARIGLIRKGTGVLSAYSKLEYGLMPNFSTYGKGAASSYFNIEIGVLVSPLIGLLDLKTQW
jgi:hypothetical protein